jgi:hypothetical protein
MAEIEPDDERITRILRECDKIVRMIGVRV